MHAEEVIDLPGDNNPVLCSDGKIGMLLIYPSADGLCGVQVSGEEEHRWIAASDLTASAAGALKQKGSPTAPTAGGIEQCILADAWNKLGGASISN